MKLHLVGKPEIDTGNISRIDLKNDCAVIEFFVGGTLTLKNDEFKGLFQRMLMALDEIA